MYLNPNDGLYYQGYENLSGEEFWWSLANGEFEGTYYIEGQVTELDASGDGTWNGLRYSSGALFSGEFEGTYYVNGQATDAFGWFMHYWGGYGDFNGLWHLDGMPLTGPDPQSGTYFVSGLPTELDSNGNGMHGGLRYSEGALFTGVFEGLRYSNGALFTGLFEGLRYSEGALLTGEFEGNYYIYGNPTDAWGWFSYSTGGTGEFEGLRYSEGALFTGEFEGVQYIQGQLASTFTGVHNDLRYDNGALFTGVFGGLRYSEGALFNGEFEGTIYVNGSEMDPWSFFMYTTGGNGEFEGNFYIDGQIWTPPSAWDVFMGDYGGTGEFEGNFYINGEATDAWGWFLYNGGSGIFEGLRYIYAELLTGEFEGTWYINGQATELDSSGNGTWNGQTYVNGVVQNGGGGGGSVKNGWIDNIFWINDVATSLDQNGDGTWVGKLYENGSLFSGTKYELTFVNGVAQPVQIITVTGNNIPVAFGLNEAEEPLVQLVFTSITSAGETAIEQIVPTVLPAGIPPQYTVAQTLLAYTINTTATFEGTIDIDFILPSNISQAAFNRCKAYHVKTNGTTEEMARVSSDYATKRITVAISSFSSFLFLDEPQGNKTVKVVGKSKFIGKVKFAAGTNGN